MHFLVTGGAGFIGANVVDRALARNDRVRILDNLSRGGVRANLEWLRERHGDSAFEFLEDSVEDRRAVEDAVRGVDVVVHLAGQTAVTTSVLDPRSDFEANALGTLNVLEALRLVAPEATLLYASTNKVYGPLAGVEVEGQPTRYAYVDRPFGIAEDQQLDFHSPYGCSKGVGDQYVRDYARIYGLRTVVFRQSCIYGPCQMGIEGQGWIAWFLLNILLGRPLRVFGDGKQVRDILLVDDLLDVYDAALARIDRAAGEAYNIGGGTERSLSIWIELSAILESLVGSVPQPVFEPARPGDQRVYISDTRKAQRELGWQPRVSVEEGLRRFAAWIGSRIETLPS